MPISPRQIATLLAAALLAYGVAGCGTINEKLSGMGDYVPQWAGGLPPDAPPRPGTARYDEYMKERERQRLIPAAERVDETRSQPAAPSGLDPVH
jgi:hypothetical protein